jgi:ABC-2 type transport system permease protein
LQNTAPPTSANITEERRQQIIEGNRLENRVQNGVKTFIDMSALALLLGAVLVMQNAIIDEKQTGTGAWILSKPVARSSFILAKLIANAAALILLAVVAQWVLAYIQISLALASAQPVLPYLIGMGLIALNLLFWLALTLMLGTLFINRAVIVAVPLGVLFLMLYLTSNIPALLDLTPIAFIVDMPEHRSMVQLAMQGQPLQSVTPIIITIAWVVVFVGVAIWRFGREEF